MQVPPGALRPSDAGMRALILTLICVAGAAGSEPARLSGHGGPIMDVTVSPDGRIASASFDNSVGLWSGTTAHWLDGHAAAVNAVLVSGDVIASAGDDFAVIVWDGDAPIRLEGHGGKVAALALSADRGTLASASWDGTIGLWPLAGGDPTFLRGHGAAITDVVFGADGALYSASADGTIRVWDVEAGSELRVIARHGFGVNTLVTGPGWLGYGAVDGGTRLISPLTGDLLADFTAERRPILAMAFSDAAGLLAVGDGEGFIMVVDTASRQVIHDFQAVGRGPVWALAFSPDGDTLFSGGLDPDLLAWDMATLGQSRTATAAAAPYLTDPALMGNGERQFQRKCSICHSLTPDTARRAGPTLHDVFGRPAGSVAGYTYSARLDRSEIVWDATTIDALFDHGPDHYIPGSKMPMQVIADPQDRADLILWLKQAATPTGADAR